MTGSTVFLGTDFSVASGEAFLLALEEARVRGRVLVIAHVIPTDVLLDCAISEVAPLRALCMKRLETLRRRAEGAGVAARIELLDGTPHAALVEAAARVSAELVVLGTRGSPGVSRVTFGSVALRVVRGAACPVFIVRAAA